MTNDNDETIDRFGRTTPYQSATFGCIGSGSTFIVDPKGDDAEQLLDLIPQERLDEVIVEVGDEE